MANKKIKLKNGAGEYLEPYTTNVPDASTSDKGLVVLDETPTAGSLNALTSGGAKIALDAKLGKGDIASKATADADGNVITTTYQKLSDAISYEEMA